MRFIIAFITMLTSKVDPFAVYAAERELKQHGRHVPHNRLFAHYLVQGQLRTLVAKIIAEPPGGRIDEAQAAALIEGPNESANPRFVAPVSTGLLLSSGVLPLVATFGVLRFAGSGDSFAGIDWRIAALIMGFHIAMCMTYAFLGARIGRARANKVMQIGVLAAVLSAILIYWLSRYLVHEN